MRPANGPLALLAWVAVMGLLATGCATEQRTIGRNDPTCFRAIPVAKAAISGVSHFVSARRLGPAGARRAFPGAHLGADGALCVVAYSGRFRPGMVRSASSGAGSYAVMVVAASDDRLVHAEVTDRLPRLFRRA